MTRLIVTTDSGGGLRGPAHYCAKLMRAYG